MEIPYKKVLALQFVLSPVYRSKLLEIYPPIHSKVIAHHMTYQYRPSQKEFEEFYWDYADRGPISSTIRGYGEDEFGQAIVLDGPSLKKIPHITISIDPKIVTPKYSNEMLQRGYKSHRGKLKKLLLEPIVVLRNQKEVRI